MVLIVDIYIPKGIKLINVVLIGKFEWAIYINGLIVLMEAWPGDDNE